MRSGNSGHPRPSTDRVKMMLRSCIASRSSGQAEYVLGMYALILVMVLALASLNIMQYKADSDIAEDALAASCLAALDIDPYRYGTDHRLVINDPLSARGIFEEALRKNLNLNAFYEPVTAGDYFISGRITVDDFRIYLTEGDRVREFRVGEYGVTESTGIYGEMRTPSGSVVRSAGAYARISFDTSGMFGIKVRACKEAYAEMLSDPDRLSHD